MPQVQDSAQNDISVFLLNTKLLFSERIFSLIKLGKKLNINESNIVLANNNLMPSI